MSIKKLTPVAMVKVIEPVLPFYQAAGFERTVEMPHGDALGFVILASGGAELMLQSEASMLDDLGNAKEKPALTPVALFVEVNDLEAVIQAMGNAPVYLPRRQTFYGSDEIGYRDPAGNFVTFAQFAAES